MDITQLLATRDAVRAIIADASIAADDKKIIVTEAIQGLRMTSLSPAPHLRSIIAKEFKQHLDNFCKEPERGSDLRVRESAGQDARSTEGPRDSGSDRNQEVARQASPAKRRK